MLRFISTLFLLAFAEVSLKEEETTVADYSQTKCYRLRAEKAVKVLNLENVSTPFPPDVADDPIKRMEYQGSHGFYDADGDGVERFRFTLVCRCFNESDVLSHIIHKGHVAEADCEGRLKGGRLRYALLESDVGRCFVASQHITQSGDGPATRYFLKVSPAVELDRTRVSIDVDKSYFAGGDFRLHRFTYRDVCNRDIGFWESYVLSRGALPLEDDGPRYAKAAYEGDVTAASIMLG
eukprot:Blabericola_migrator_1__8107@NODE_4176_length_1296_cov_176_414972_g2587_i0_p1_GENE_NODE_4176_length_1296_cov_176_414972_g2587_i0NODE_4176_length_1296_cov_176_414972_g2587_i0_p1_ORF_typecomplete_len252_score25_69_NODE_4176_length_1296_cov_176_414972_g2587_i05401250